MVMKSNKYITQEELKAHNHQGDVWISIYGKVYDVSNWVKAHPGGEAPLMNLAGLDVTDAFIAYHPRSSWHYLDKFSNGYHVKDFEVTEVSKDYRSLYSEINKMGMFDNKGHGVAYWFFMIAVMLIGCVIGVVGSDSLVVHLGCAMLLGMAWIQSTYLGHDSGHYVIMSSRGANKFAQLLCGNCLTGISIAWWKWTHNAHHIACNSLDHDPDLQHIPVFAVSSKLFHDMTSYFYGRKMMFDRVARFLVSYQHLTFYPILIVARINLYFQTFLLLLSRRNVPDRALNIVGILVFWTWFPLLLSCLPNWTERFLFVLASFSVTSLQHLQFCLNHFAANVYVGKPNGNDWFEKQTSGTIDISCSPWMDWVYGGLQFQLEHHLFPRLPQCQLRKIAPLVRDLSKKHNLPYRSLSFLDANIWTIRTLRTAALQAQDLTNPTTKSLLWEAVNTHG
ncbi:hypothetical protein Droror1_Dr00000568 [Drosera rotundifolia]